MGYIKMAADCRIHVILLKDINALEIISKNQKSYNYNYTNPGGACHKISL